MAAGSWGSTQGDTGLGPGSQKQGKRRAVKAAKRVVGTPRAGRVILALALASALAAIAVSPASAAFRHPVVTGSFGSDGTRATTIGGLDQLAYNQSANRLYAYGRSPSKIYGFDTATRGRRLRSAASRSTSSAGGGDPDVAVDNSPSSAGNFYYLTEGSGLYGFSSAGGPLSGFPVGGFQDSCGAATDGEGQHLGRRLRRAGGEEIQLRRGPRSARSTSRPPASPATSPSIAPTTISSSPSTAAAPTSSRRATATRARP